jgi:hypothetical protein
MKKRVFLIIMLVAVLVVLAPSVQAASITFGLDVEFSGATQPAGSPPWITATFDDSFGDLNTVRLIMSADNLVGDESIGFWLFNFDPTLDLTQLSFTAVSNTASVPNISTDINVFKADGDGLYDIQFNFPPPPGDFIYRFTTGESVIYDITYVAPIDVYSFNFLSAIDGGQGTYFTAAQIQSIGQAGESGWIGTPIPEPSTMLLLGGGLIGLGAFRRRFRKK